LPGQRRSHEGEAVGRAGVLPGADVIGQLLGGAGELARPPGRGSPSSGAGGSGAPASKPIDALSVAAPVQDAHGQVVATVSLVARHGSSRPLALAQLVRTSARAISRALGALL
jgi:hypothetical protein